MNVAMTDVADVLPSGTGPEGRSISVIITAMNEEGNLRPTVDAVVKAIAPRFPQYEVIIIDDGSRDGTPHVAQQLAADNARIRVHRNPRNLGLAHSYRTGIRLTTGQYTSWVAGNNLVPAERSDRIYDRVRAGAMVVTYILRDVRGRRRQCCPAVHPLCESTVRRPVALLHRPLCSVRRRQTNENARAGIDVRGRRCSFGC
jgi:glycosyltransferase involved in cell wall biosynthesis